MLQIGNNFHTAYGLFGTCALILLALLATWPAVRAYQKGRSFLYWYIFSLFLLPMAIIASFIVNGKEPIEERKSLQ